MTDKAYCYPPDYTVLKNKAGLEEQNALDKFERLKTTNRMRFSPFDLPISYSGYKAIHQHIFQDVYDWAGQSRTVTIHKGDSFANWMYVDQEMAKRFALIKQENNLKQPDLKQFSNRAAEHISEINAIHPFREGNGRVQRLFIRNLAYQSGHELRIDRIDQAEWMSASIEGFREQNYEPMARCIYGAVGPERQPDRTLTPSQQSLLDEYRAKSEQNDKKPDRMQDIERDKDGDRER